jgi:hypothetical protein
MGRKSYHCHFTKPSLIRAIIKEGSRSVLNNFEGTEDEAIQLVIDHPYEYVAVHGCENVDETGRCKGHPMED